MSNTLILRRSTATYVVGVAVATALILVAAVFAAVYALAVAVLGVVLGAPAAAAPDPRTRIHTRHGRTIAPGPLVPVTRRALVDGTQRQS